MMKLDVGCGARCHDGFDGVDIRHHKGVRFVCFAWHITKHVQPGTVDEILARHFLEHLAPADALKTLKAFYEVMKNGASLRIIVPDLKYHANQLLLEPNEPSDMNPNISNHTHALAGFYGWGHHEFDHHKTGYTHSSLKRLLEENGFYKIHRMDTPAWDLGLRCEK